MAESSSALSEIDSSVKLPVVYKRKKISMDEDDFQEGIASIVRRDFFPDVEKLERDRESECDATDKKCTLNLDEYLNRYESEDDASFTGMLEKANKLHHQKHAWLHKQEESYQLAAQEKLALGGGTAVRQAGVESWTYTAKNSLMYVPDGVESSAVELIKGSSKTRKIIHCNTRLPEEFVQKAKVSATIDSRKPAQNKVGVDGKEVAVDGSPQVNGYGFLSTPQIKPGVDASPLMTWGTIEGTPVRIDSNPIIGGPTFKIPKIPSREKIALKLADQVAKSSREKRKATPVITSPLLRERSGTMPSKLDRLRLLSPAARKLIERKSGLTDKILNASYSPQLNTVYSQVKTPTTASKSTPAHHHTPSLTDDLLDIDN